MLAVCLIALACIVCCVLTLRTLAGILRLKVCRLVARARQATQHFSIYKL